MDRPVRPDAEVEIFDPFAYKLIFYCAAVKIKSFNHSIYLHMKLTKCQ